jgi:hypothetical protein
MQLPKGKLPMLQHLPALVTAAGSSSSEVASAADRVLSELAVPECIAHLSELLQLMQQGKVAAAELVVRLSKLPAAKTALHVPALVAAVGADSNYIATAAVLVLHDLPCCSMAESIAGTSAATATAAAAALATRRTCCR